MKQFKSFEEYLENDISDAYETIDKCDISELEKKKLLYAISWLKYQLTTYHKTCDCLGKAIEDILTDEQVGEVYSKFACYVNDETKKEIGENMFDKFTVKAKEFYSKKGSD